MLCYCPKTKKREKIHRFRTINIVEADLNMAIRILIARRLMKKAEQQDLPDEQWGGRKGRSSMDLGLNKLLSIDYARVTRRPLGVVELDATACFDRIVRPVGIVSLIKQGLEPAIAKWFLTWLNQARHYQIINGHISSLSYPSQLEKAQGLGQGLTGAGTVWLTTDTLVSK